MRLSYVQTRPVLGGVRANTEDALRRLAGLRTDLAVLPELFNTGYHFTSPSQAKRLAEPVTGPTVRALEDFARGRGMAVAAGFAERAGSKLYNSAVLVTPSKTTLYRKVHVFAREKKFFKPGNLPFPVVNFSGVKVGLMICFDWFFPEAARTLALRGAQVLAHPANLVLPWCPEAMKIRCLENRVLAVTANRVGKERGLSFIGQSQIVSTRGKVLRRASRRGIEAATLTVNPRDALSKRLNPYNDLFKDRRPAFYAP